MAASEEILGMLHERQAAKLLELLEKEDVTAAELAQINAFLRQNNITCAPAADNSVDRLQKMLGGAKVPTTPSLADLPDEFLQSRLM